MLGCTPHHPREPDSKPKDLYVGWIFLRSIYLLCIYAKAHEDFYSMGMNKRQLRHLTYLHLIWVTGGRPCVLGLCHHDLYWRGGSVPERKDDYMEPLGKFYLIPDRDTGWTECFTLHPQQWGFQLSKGVSIPLKKFRGVNHFFHVPDSWFKAIPALRNPRTHKLFSKWQALMATWLSCFW